MLRMSYFFVSVLLSEFSHLSERTESQKVEESSLCISNPQIVTIIIKHSCPSQGETKMQNIQKQIQAMRVPGMKRNDTTFRLILTVIFNIITMYQPS
jgi:hypothetical protein